MYKLYICKILVLLCVILFVLHFTCHDCNINNNETCVVGERTQRQEVS